MLAVDDADRWRMTFSWHQTYCSSRLYKMGSAVQLLYIMYMVYTTVCSLTPRVAQARRTGTVGRVFD